MITWVWSCSSASEEATDDPTNNPPDQPKEYIVSLGMTGEILDIEESPLSKAGGNNLYGVQVHSKTATTDYTPYAYGLFDDKSLMTIKLLEGYQYKFQVTMVTDGKNRIYDYKTVTTNLRYGAPFDVSGPTAITNKFIYDNYNYMGTGGVGADIYVGNSYGSYRRPNIERFYGKVIDYTPKEKENISIFMHKFCFGAKFIAEGLTEGKLKIKLEYAPELNILNGQSEVQDIFVMRNLGFNQKGEIFETDIVPISIHWEKADGAIVPLINKEITFKRNVLTTITIKVKDTTMDNNIDITHESGEMAKGEDIVLESGTGLDGNIDPVEK